MKTAAGHKKRQRRKLLLTTMIAVVIAAILVVGFFLLWEDLDIKTRLTAFFDRNVFGPGKSFTSGTSVTTDIKGADIEEDEKKLLSDYYLYTYSSLGDMKSYPLTDLFTFQNEYELFDKLSVEQEIACAKTSSYDMSFDECDIRLYITDRKEIGHNGDIRITLVLDTTVHYKGLSQPTVTAGEKHSFILDNTGKTPLLKSHDTVRPSYSVTGYAIDSVLAGHNVTRKDLTYTYYYKYLDEIRQMLGADGETLSGAVKEQSYPAAEYGYDRVTAALSCVNGFGGDGVFKEYEENDANYVSRCIFTGGIPMDAQGDRKGQWKWYDEQVNTQRRKVGCSESWYDRKEFYEYAIENSGFGMVACETEENAGEFGDVIQLMAGEEPVCEVMITGILYGDGGVVSDYLVSNDVYTGFPMKLMGFNQIRVIHIIGYNTANI